MADQKGAGRRNTSARPATVNTAADQPDPADPQAEPTQLGRQLGESDKMAVSGFTKADGTPVDDLVDFMERGGVTVLTAPENVYVSSPIPGTNVQRTQLLYRAGQVVPLGEVEAAAGRASGSKGVGPTENGALPGVESKE